ncbi:MAG: hypothetical protein AAF938_00200 [Myxococcota bacterium]
MAHRDGHQAALLRAEALERELAEAKEALAEKERELAARRATDEGGAAEPSGTADPNASLAQLRIDAGRMAEELEAKGAKEAEERVRSEAAKDRAQERERRRRIVRSASAFGFLFAPGTLLLALPVFAMTTYAAGVAQLPIRFSIAVLPRPPSCSLVRSSMLRFGRGVCRV